MDKISYALGLNVGNNFLSPGIRNLLQRKDFVKGVEDALTDREPEIGYDEAKRLINEGEEAKPEAFDEIKSHYHGTLINGKIFDSSLEQGEPAYGERGAGENIEPGSVLIFDVKLLSIVK
jgi:FKBP-type peptidyl-prolyl cis-trans isomerase FklB